MEKVKLIAGRSNRPLAEHIANYLDLVLVDCYISQFAAGEIQVEINEDVRNTNVYIVQTGITDEKHSINDYLVETLMLIDACKRSGVSKVSVIFASLAYARSDKKDKPRVPIGAAVVVNILKSIGCDRIISVDLHSGQIQGFTTLPFDNLYCINLNIEKLKNTIFLDLSQEEINDKYILVSLDVGGAKRVKEYAKRLNMKYCIMDKQRDYSQHTSTIINSVIIGNVEGKIAICIDDMVDTCGTIVAGITDLIEHKASGAIILATHGIFSEPALDRLNKCDFIQKIIVSNTLNQSSNIIKCIKLEVIDISPLLANVIKCLTVGGSISDFFK